MNNKNLPEAFKNYITNQVQSSNNRLQEYTNPGSFMSVRENRKIEIFNTDINAKIQDENKLNIIKQKLN